MIRRYERAVLFGLLALLLLTLGAVLFTHSWTDYRERLRALRLASAHDSSLVDTRPLDTAQQLAQLAVTRVEQNYAAEALRLADHSVDLAFDAALRDAAENPAPLTPQTREIQKRIKKAETSIASDKSLVAQLTQEMAKATGSDKDDAQVQLGIVQAQLSLDQDDLEDAQQELLRSGADKRALVQQLLDQHNASEHSGASTSAAANSSSETSVEVTRSGSVVAQARAWWSLNSKESQLVQAQSDAQALASELSASHDVLAKQLDQEKAQRKILHKTSESSESESGDSPSQAAALPMNSALSFIHELAADQKDVAEVDKRLEFEKQLAADYGNWIDFVRARQEAFLHGIFLSFFWFLLTALFVWGANLTVQRIFVGVAIERRRLHTIRVITLFIVQAAGALVILLAIFGMPSNLATVIALATAGITVAMKDFIVGILGRFVLMGKNGIRPGDWVEINGVCGEVLELGVLHTVLLETGNLNEVGYPTGRQVSFVNSYAIEGHYFNFSTSGQWLWDEIEVQVPESADPYEISEAIQKIAANETDANAKLAQADWSRVVPSYAHRSFSAEPSLSFQPTGAGVKILVRYITRVNERHELRARLYRAIVDLLHRKDIPESAAAGAQPVSSRG